MRGREAQDEVRETNRSSVMQALADHSRLQNLFSLESFQTQRSLKPGFVFSDDLLASARRMHCRRGKSGKEGGGSGRAC